MWIFIKESLRKFVQQGSVAPSSTFLARRMTRAIDAKKGICVVELGAGTGAFTKQIIAQISPKSKLYVFEISPVFAEHLRKNHRHDKRVQIIEGDAADLGEHLRRLNSGPVDYVISGLPLGNFPKSTQQKILLEINKVLREKGTYVQFQYFLASWPRIRSMFDAKIVSYEWRNIPPAFVYECMKRDIIHS